MPKKRLKRARTTACQQEQIRRTRKNKTLQPNHPWNLAKQSFYTVLNSMSEEIYRDRCKNKQHHYVNCFLIVGNKIISGGTDNTIKVWNSETFHCEYTLEAHTGSVLYLLQVENKLLSCSTDSLIKVWDMETWQCERTLEGHRFPVYAMMQAGDTLVSGSTDKAIIEWDIHSWSCTSTTQPQEKL